MAQSLRYTSVEGFFINDKDIGGIKSTKTAKIASRLKVRFVILGDVYLFDLKHHWFFLAGLPTDGGPTTQP